MAGGGGQAELVFESHRLTFRPLQPDDLDLAIEQWTDLRVVQYVAERTYAVEETLIEDVAGTIDPENATSRRVLEKCGLHHQGPIRAYGADLPG